MSAPRRFADRYELRELVGVGGMSEVHLARDLRLDRDVAVKVLHADLADDASVGARFRREAQKTAGLNHRGIAAVYDTGVGETATGSPLYIVMEYVDGPTLRDVVRDRGAMTPRRAVSVIADVCEALEFSHRHGVIHRDVKPANIMLTKDGAVKVVDFGIARALADGDGGITRTGAVMGTAHYLSPEQARGGPVDARSDVYSVGCVLYEMATGQAPFSGDSPVAIVYQHVHQDPGAPSRRNGDLTPAFDAVVAKAMAKDPDERYQSAADMRVDLIRLQNGDVPYAAARRPADSTSPLPVAELRTMVAPDGAAPGSRRPRSRRLMAIGMVTVLVAAAAVVAVGLGTVGSTDEALLDVRGRTVADAIAVLHDRGLSTRVEKRVHPTVPVDHVIDTDPVAGTAVAAGSEITIEASTGPGPDRPDGAQLEVPDVAALTYADAIRVLTNAGFRGFRQASLPSSPEMTDRVLATNPPARRRAESTAVITVVMGSGPVAGTP
ncbi:Stk1 family PASTA domain-containing Ser/Thr kinase [Mycobacterium hodleri]|uniref:Stk1 family PASTA domain-containing Ser/Thr kinase n=1 Tax=Mycolicibacterium hodleri TaxID=49897 RepID=UPI0021F34F31|nr:Stk1 family PASTA domain-containing Ser/Thr kinase [Mycolicibacterium hodleri]MCV7133854.1 Stk1 family PASTA domain-containing Ser/Thr kinase [Mycolicibacterium hodleri]